MAQHGLGLSIGILLLALPGLVVGQSTDYSRVGIETLGAGARGIVECKADLELAFPVPGIVAEVPVREGDVVVTGDLLLSLQQTVETIELQRREEVWRDKADLIAAEAQLKLALTQLDAAQRIFDQSRGISAEDLASRKLQHELLVAERTRILSQERIEGLDVQTARESLARRTLYAPGPGTVSDLLRNVGEAVQPSDVVVRLCDTSQLFIATNVPSDFAALLQLDAGLDLEGRNPLTGADIELRGTVTFLAPTVDPASGLQRIKLRLDAPPPWLKPGTSLALRLSSG
jgi:RND family efflux transporter MFP subunit